MKNPDRKIFVADNQDITRFGVIYLLVQEMGINCVDEAFSKKEILESLKRFPESILIIDYSNLDFERVEEILIISEKYSKVSFLFISDDYSFDFLKRLIMSEGNFSFLSKDCSSDDFKYCINKILDNDRFIARNLYSRIFESIKHVTEEEKTISLLTPMEKMVLQEIAKGKTTKEIAELKNLSFHTINTHRKNIFRKIDVNNVKEAIRYAIRAGLIDMVEYHI